MTEQILTGISLALSAAFPSCTVFGDERVRQGLKTPSFFVGLGECHLRPLPNGMMEQRQTVEVIYFPVRVGDYTELWSVGPQATELLKELELPDGSRIRGGALRCSANDGLLHMGATYTLRQRPVERRELMGDMALKI